MKRKALSWLLVLCLIVGLLPTAALAAEDGVGGDAPVVCAELDGCTGDDHAEGCPLYVAPEPCGRIGNPGRAPVEETEDPASVVSAVTALQERINALPDADTLEEMDEDEQAEVYAEVCDIYDAIDELTDEEAGALDMDALEEAAAFFTRQIMPLDGETTGEMSGSCGATDSDSVTWKLEQNNKDAEKSTYTLTISGEGAMKDYKDGDTIPWSTYSGSVTEVVVDDGVTVIGRRAFQNFSSLTSVSIPNSVTKILTKAFEKCSQLSSITIPDSVTELGYWVFSECGALTTFSASGVTTMGDGVLNKCTSLTSASFPALTTLGGSTFGDCEKLTSYDLGEVTTIPSSTFSDCKALPDSAVNLTGITEIGKDAFKNCEALVTIVFPDSVSKIGQSAFTGSHLTSVTIGAGMTEIGSQAFKDCDELVSLTILPSGASLTIKSSAFENTSITNLTIPARVSSVEQSAFGKSGSTAILHSIDMTQINSNLTITEGAFSNLEPIIYINQSGDSNKLNTMGCSTKVVAVTNGGTFAADTEFTSDTLAAPIREGYIFAGWYDEQLTGNPVTEIEKNQTYYAKWIELTSADITMEYGSEKALSEITVAGVALTDWTSANSNVAKIEGDKLVATGVGDTTITASAALDSRSGEKLTVNVKVNPMPITFGTGEGENPHGTITYQYTGMAPDFAQFAKFYQAVKGQDSKYAAGEKAITLTEGTDIVFEYDAGGGKNDYHYLPIDVTENQTYGIEVIVKLVNPNYRFVTESNQTLSETIKENVVVKSENLKEVSFEGVPAAGATMTYPYNGQPQPPVSNLTRMSAGNIDKFTVHFHPWGDTEFTEAHLENQTVDELTPEAIRKIAPTEPGSYLMIVDGVSDTEYAYRSWIFTITKATVTIRPNDKSAYVGDAVPVLGTDDYTVTGLVGDDTLSTEPTLAYEGTPDMSKAGTYAIKASGAAANETHYTLLYEDGTLTVSRRSSGGGGGGSSSGNTTTETEKNPDGSTTTTVTDKKTGTVTETTKFKDGSTLVVETKKDGTVTTTETAKNGVKVRTVEEPGEDVTAKVTIPKSVGEAVVTIPADVDYGMVAVDADTGEVVKLSVPTREGMTVKLDGSADLVLVDRSRDFTDTRGHWAEDAIDFATAHELFAGTSDTTFTPDSPMTRAMLMTVLARFDGQDTTGGAVWYEKAMAWARENGISDGSNPNGSITREQLATMLWRYAGSPAGDGSLSAFGDSASVNGYAVDAMRWAVGEGLISGTGAGLLAPQGNATRAQVATILMRFVENLTK